MSTDQKNAGTTGTSNTGASKNTMQQLLDNKEKGGIVTNQVIPGSADSTVQEYKPSFDEVLAAVQGGNDSSSRLTPATTPGDGLPSGVMDLTLADLKSGNLSDQQLATLFTQLTGGKLMSEEEAKAKATASNWSKFKKVYQFPSAPTSFHFPGKGAATIIPEGIYGTNDDKEIKELDAAVEVGNIWVYNDPTVPEDTAKYTNTPKPIDTKGVN